MEIKSGNEALDSLVQNWLEWDDQTSKSYARVLDLVTQKNWSTLEKMMLNRLKFGTAGIRGKMADGFAYLNDLVIIQTSQGLAQYVLKCFPSPNEARKAGAVISFDARYNSSRWAKLCARVFANAGYKVYLFNKITPTPFVPFTVQQKGAAIGIMITASHNPKEDNGYKVYWNNGPQIKPPHDKFILESINEHLKPADDHVYNEDLSEFNDNIIDPTEEIGSLYYSMLHELTYDQSLNSDFSQKIVYTAMHGVGASYIDHAFETVKFKPVIHVSEQKDPNPDFPTAPFPNPEEGKTALNLSFQTAEEHGAIYILANDPDADRLAIVQKLENGTWKIFNGNEIGCLLAWWQLHVHNSKYGDKYNKKNLYYIASTVSSKILGAIAKKEGLNFEETLTGFKWMANKAYDLEQNSENKILLAYEEAIGFMCGTQVLDKDGISAAIRSMELIAFLDRKGMTLVDKLNEIYKEYGYHCNLNSYFIVTDSTINDQIFKRLRNYQGSPNTYPTILANKYQIAFVRDLTTGYDNSTQDTNALLPTDASSHMITFTFENGVKVTLRTSGTEPKLKYYAEYCGKPDQTDWEAIKIELAEMVNHMSEEFIEASKHGLKAKND